jgi:hypothetical protein
LPVPRAQATVSMGPASLCIDQLVMYIHFDEKLLEDVMNFMMKVLVSMISTQAEAMKAFVKTEIVKYP